jgi:Bacteriophage tail sheath protein
MPSTLTYPGVYIEEIPSGVHTIIGVATSITAFVGWSRKGPSDKAQQVLSWQDFERYYGGLDGDSLLGYAVYHFFANGGQRAYVVRLVAPDAVAATVSIDGKLTFTAKNKGKWAESYAVATKQLASDPTRFRVQVLRVDGTTETPVESYQNLSMLPTDSRFVERVINGDSATVNVAVAVGATTPPADTGTPSPKFAGSADGATLSPNAGTFETALNPPAKDSGIYLLDRIDLFNILCVPGESTPAVVGQLERFCRDRRAFLIADCDEAATFASLQAGPNNNLTGDDAINAAFYFPWVNAPDPNQENRPRDFPPCGFAAGLYAKTDSNRGVWKAPAGIEASLSAISGVKEVLTNDENGVLNVQAINCIRSFPVYGTVIWGARTLQGNDERGSEWKYVPVRRTALFLEETLYRNTKWVVFEPNDEPLWAQIRLNVGAFMHDMFRQGAFQGGTPKEAYFVKCDSETTTQSDINRGIVNIVVGFAPLKPAEFVVIKIQQIAGQIQV